MSASATPFRVEGFDRFPRARAELEAGISEGVAPGMVAAVWDPIRDPDAIELMALGERRRKYRGFEAQPMLANTVFDLASVTKAMATATLAATLVDRGWIRYDEPLSRLLPAYAHPRITLAHLLSHTGGLPAWAPLYGRLRERFAPDPLYVLSVEERQAAMRSLVLAVEPERGVGEQAVYSDLSFLLLGFALEEATQMPLDQAVRRFVWEPMGLYADGRRGPFYRRTTQAPFSDRLEEAAATEDCPWRGTVLQGQVHDDNCWSMGGYGGHAGAFGTAEDVLGFARALSSGFLSDATLHQMWARVSEPAGCDRTLGWDTPSGDAPGFGRFFSPRSIGHFGFTGTSLWIDPDRGLAVTLLSNRVHPTRENPLFKPFRGRFHEALFADLTR